MPKILYFSKRAVPTEAELAEAKALGALLRNAAASRPDEAPEDCDSVAGAVPEHYKSFPVAAPDQNEQAPDTAGTGEQKEANSTSKAKSASRRRS